MWRYRSALVRSPDLELVRNVDKACNEFAAEGWELVTIGELYPARGVPADFQASRVAARTSSSR